MSHVSQNLAALNTGAIGLTDPLLYHVELTQESIALVPGDGVVLCRALKPLSVTLPRAATCAGRAFAIMKVDTSLTPVTVTSQDPNDTINGQKSVILQGIYETKLFLSDGRTWWIFARDSTALHLNDPGTVPAGGTAQQVLQKNSNTSWDVSWVTPYWEPLGAPGVRDVRAAGGVITTEAAVTHVVLPADPVTPLGAATKQYVDAMGQAASGDLQGTYPAPTIVPGAVTQAKLAAGAATGVNSSETVAERVVLGATETGVYTKALTTVHGGGLLLLAAAAVQFPPGPGNTYTVTMRLKLDGTTLAQVSPGAVGGATGQTQGMWTATLFAFQPLLTPGPHTVTVTGQDTTGAAVTVTVSCVVVAFA